MLEPKLKPEFAPKFRLKFDPKVGPASGMARGLHAPMCSWRGLYTNIPRIFEPPLFFGGLSLWDRQLGFLIEAGTARLDRGSFVVVVCCF